MRTLCLLSLLLLPACSWDYSPQHGPVDAASLQKLSSQVRDPAELGFIVKDGAIRFELNVQSPDKVRLPMTLRSGLPDVQASLNDQPPVHLILDTGAQRTVLDARTAIACKVALQDRRLGSTTLAGTLGREDGYLGLLAPFQLGDFHMSRYVCLVRTQQNAVRYFGDLRRSQISLDILGMDLPKRLFSYLTLDYTGAEVILGVRGLFQPEKGARVWKAPVVWQDGLPCVYLQSNGTRWLALVDSGFSDALEVTEQIAKDIGIYDKRMKVSGGYQIAIGGAQTAGDSMLGVAVVPKLEGMGPVTANIPTVITHGRPKVGSGLLKRFTVTIDFARSVLWVEDRLAKGTPVAGR